MNVLSLILADSMADVVQLPGAGMAGRVPGVFSGVLSEMMVQALGPPISPAQFGTVVSRQAQLPAMLGATAGWPLPAMPEQETPLPMGTTEPAGTETEAHVSSGSADPGLDEGCVPEPGQVAAGCVLAMQTLTVVDGMVRATPTGEHGAGTDPDAGPALIAQLPAGSLASGAGGLSSAERSQSQREHEGPSVRGHVAADARSATVSPAPIPTSPEGAQTESTGTRPAVPKGSRDEQGAGGPVALADGDGPVGPPGNERVSIQDRQVAATAPGPAKPGDARSVDAPAPHARQDVAAAGDSVPRHVASRPEGPMRPDLPDVRVVDGQPTVTVVERRTTADAPSAAPVGSISARSAQADAGVKGEHPAQSDVVRASVSEGRGDEGSDAAPARSVEARRSAVESGSDPVRRGVADRSNADVTQRGGAVTHARSDSATHAAPSSATSPVPPKEARGEVGSQVSANVARTPHQAEGSERPAQTPAPSAGRLTPEPVAADDRIMAVSRQLLSHLSQTLGRGGRECRIELHPEALGRVHARLSMGDTLTVHLTVETSQAQQAVRQALPELRVALESRGIALGQCDVGFLAHGNEGGPWHGPGETPLPSPLIPGMAREPTVSPHGAEPLSGPVAARGLLDVMI